MLAASHHYFHAAADVLGLSDRIREILITPKRIVRVELVTENERGILVVPDILANAGGVTVSYFEWAQNVQQFRWEVDRVVSELERTMVRAYADVESLAQERSIDLWTAAFALGVQRVARSATSRVSLREEIDMK